MDNVIKHIKLVLDVTFLPALDDFGQNVWVKEQLQ